MVGFSPAVKAIVPADNPRDIRDIINITIMTHILSIGMYWGLGLPLLLNRSKWQGQKYWLVVIFIFWPWIMSAQLLIDVVCVIRNLIQYPATTNRFRYYLSGLIGQHHAMDDQYGPLLNWRPARIMDHRSARYRLQNIPWDDTRTYTAVFSLVPLVQGLFAFWIFYRRRYLLSSTTGDVYLGIDFRNGWMAFNGTLAALVSLARLLMKWDWYVDVPDRKWEKTYLNSLLDTSNAWVFAIAGAIIFQIVRFDIIVYAMHHRMSGELLLLTIPH